MDNLSSISLFWPEISELTQRQSKMSLFLPREALVTVLAWLRRPELDDLLVVNRRFHGVIDSGTLLPLRKIHKASGLIRDPAANDYFTELGIMSEHGRAETERVRAR